MIQKTQLSTGGRKISCCLFENQKYFVVGIIILLLFLYCTPLSAGPKKIGKINRNLWPYEISSPSEFDFASEMEMLVFSDELNKLEKIVHSDTLKNYLNIRSVNNESVNLWLSKIKSIIASNFSSLNINLSHQYVKINQVSTWTCIVDEAKTLQNKLPENMKSWYNGAQLFYEYYAYEQLRLAALFPRITSEILLLDETEQNGLGYDDKQFLLTFDDGPTVKGGNTDQTIAVLKKHDEKAVFFVIGDVLNRRLNKDGSENLKMLYENMEVGSHGKVHKVHPKYADWEYSLNYTDSIINKAIGVQNKYFRPPYGQRNSLIVDHLKNKGQICVLWNIDSQDWNAKINSQEVADRVLTLMLLWRRGIILFHDIHPKAKVALPKIWKQLEGSGVRW